MRLKGIRATEKLEFERLIVLIFLMMKEEDDILPFGNRHG
jgi:hypothetical protein